MEDKRSTEQSTAITRPYLSIAKQIYNVYIPSYHFPEWVLDPQIWETFDFHKTVVYYDKEENIEDVHLMIKEREPCNISMRRIYFEDKLQELFGWKHGAYRKSTPDKLMPNIAIYCHALVFLPTGYKKIHVINLTGYAFDEMHQPDYIYFKTKSITHIVEKYHKMWLKAFYAALDLKKASKINKIKIFNVGGGAFAGPYFETFIETIFEPAFLPLMPFFERAGIEVLGYDTQTKEFNGGYIPNILNTDKDVETTLYVNAWDPWSLIGNGNERDRSLDGYWGRCSNMAVLGWSETNPYIRTNDGAKGDIVLQNVETLSKHSDYKVNPLNHFRGV